MTGTFRTISRRGFPGRRPGILLRHYPLVSVLAAACLGFLAGPSHAQDLEPRRWSHLPTGINFAGVGVGYVTGDIVVDPVLEIEDAGVDLYSIGASYVRTFGLFGKSARFDVKVPYVDGEWAGLLQGAPASARRIGFKDPSFRLSMLLAGGPALDREAFAASSRSNTVVGAAISVTAPLGEYFGDKLINLGDNRWIIRPQIGVTHTRGRWTYELTGSVFLFTDNDDFQGRRLENDPLWAIQGHLIHTFRPGLWMSLSSAYGNGAEPTIDGVPRPQVSRNWLYALAGGLPISRRQGLNVALIRTETQYFTGADLTTLLLSYTQMF